MAMRETVTEIQQAIDQAIHDGKKLTIGPDPGDEVAQQVLAGVAARTLIALESIAESLQKLSSTVRPDVADGRPRVMVGNV